MDGSDILRELEDTQFPQKLRGYDPAQVDALIDRATREIADLRAERRAALDRAEMAEKRIEQELDATQKARATAEAEIATAEAKGRRFVAEAEAEAATLRSAAEAEVRAAIEEARQRLLDETTVLEVARDSVRDDISIMERHIDAHRERLLGTLGDLRKLVEAAPARPMAERRASGDERRPVEPEPPEAKAAPTRVEPGEVQDSGGQEPPAPVAAAKPPPSKVVPGERPADLPTLAVPGGGLLDELRQSVGSEGAAMDAFFTDDG
ncbi:MAG: DivIVA domain-containing protein [Actinobacteria bacterium]|nr:DivIVA domain-containing protein [Actinomycetota bacterium]